MKIKRKTEGEKKPRSSFAGLPVMKKSLGVLADVRILLAVFAVVLVVMGIFAFAFRQIHVGYVDEDGAVVTSSTVYDRLNRGSGDVEQIELTGVRGNDEIFSRGGKYYVGMDMTEFKPEYPIYANNGQSLYFTNDESQLVTEDFSLLSTYAGMFVADGTSFNAGRDQADLETIYLVKLRNGLYENALPMTFTRAGYTRELPVNCIVHFDEDGIRYFDEQGGLLSYGELTDASSLTVEINGKSYTYTEFLEALNGAGKETVQSPSDTTELTPEDSETPEENQEQLTGSQTVPSQQVDSQKPENGNDDKDSSDNKERKDQNQSSAGSTSGSAEGSFSGSNSGSGSSSSGKDSGKDGKDGSTSGSSSSNQAHPGSNASADAPYQKPSVKVNGIKPGVYSVDLDVTINDDGGYLKKVTSRVTWNEQRNEQRKSVRESGTYTINNLESGKKMTLILEMKYRNTLGEYVTEEVYSTTFTTLSIAEGTNTLYLDYQPDTWTEEDQTKGYERIYPDQIEIRHMTIREGDDSILEDAGSTMNYVRYFRINIFDADKNDKDPVASYVLSNSDKKKMLIVEDTKDEDTGEEGSEGTGSGEGTTGGSTAPVQEGLNWISDKVIAPLDSDKDYYYEFELTDRFGEKLKVKYEDVENNTSRYDNKGNLITGKDSDRKAYTCKQHPTGKLTMGSATYKTQTITVDLNNPNKSTVSDLYVTVQDSYGRYIGHEQQNGNIVGHVEEGGQETATARYMLMNKDAENLHLYEGLEGSNAVSYDNREQMTWSKFQVPSFANSVYTIKLKISYDIGDRYGDLGEDNSRTGIYTKELAVRSNCKTTSLNTLGNVSFSRAAGDMYADQVQYNYASSEISTSLLPMIYRYDYELKNTKDSSDVPLKLRVSKDYDEIKEEKGVRLSIPGNSDLTANEWAFNYSYSYRERNDSARTVHTITGRMTWDEAAKTVTRTVFEDGKAKDSVVTTVADADPYSAYITALAQMKTYSQLIGDTTVSDNSVVVVSATSVALDFPNITSGDGTVKINVNDNYFLGMPVDNLRKALDDISQQADSEKHFSNVILCALSKYETPLAFQIKSLKSSQVYQADAKAYAYQSGNMDAKTDENGNIVSGSVGAPRITLVTNTDATLLLNTLKGEPIVNMDLFSSSSELRLFDFYVLDKDNAILPKKDGEDPHVTVSIYQYNEGAATVEGSETLVARRTGLSVAHSEEEAEQLAQDLVFSGLTSGQKYLIKVTAEVYDITPDGSDRKYNQLIGKQEGSTFWKENGVWEDVVGTSVTTDLTLEEVLQDDPDTMANQLIDFTTAETEGSGWELGYMNGATGGLTNDRSYWTTPLMDLRKYDDKGQPVDLNYSDTFLAKGIWDMRVFYYDKQKNYLGYMKYTSSYNSAEKVDRYAIVRLPEVRLDGTSNGNWNVSDIAYARVSMVYNMTDVAFFGRLDDAYLTTKSEGNSDSYNDILGTMMGENLWSKLGSVMTGSKTYPNTEGQSVTISGYYETPIDVKGGQIVQITSNSTSDTYERQLTFLNDQGQVIVNEADGKATQNSRMIRYGNLIVVPKAATQMLVQRLNGNNREDQSGLYILRDTKWAEKYNDWRAGISAGSLGTGDSGSLKVEYGKSMNGNGAYTVAGDPLYEATSRIQVNPGDLYYIANQGQIINFYDSKDKFVGYSSSNWVSSGYLVIPKGVAYVRLVNYDWSKDLRYDRSLLNGFAYNTEGAYPIVFLKLGNLASIYQKQVSEGGDTEQSPDQMYANLRVQLKDGVNNYFTDGQSKDGKYWLEVYEAAYNGAELSDEELMNTPAKIEAESSIPRVATADGKTPAQEVNRCVTIPVKKGYSYKVILNAQVGAHSSVEVGTVYFTVRQSGQPVYGISAAIQMMGIRNDAYGDYVLNKDITMDNSLVTNGGGSFYGELDLQGHTLTNSRLTYIFDNIGSAAKKQGAIRNGTIQIKAIRSTGDSLICYNNYGTLENLNFKVDAQNPYETPGGEKVYDNSRWPDESYGVMIYYNHGTIRNFTVEYQADLVSRYGTGFVWDNCKLIQNGYVYGDGSVMGGSYVGGLAAINDTTGTIRNIYSTIDSKSNSTALGGNITTTYANGTVVGNNRGKTENVLATGNVYTYTSAKSGSNYVFGSESYYTTRGCAVGVTTNRMDTSNCYYATLGTNRRVNYASNSLNERVEAGMLVDPSWWSSLYQTADGEQGLLDNLDEMIAGGYFPWVDMGHAREKYSILQPYLSMNVGSAANFDLMKSTVDKYIYDKDGKATANVTFIFMNESKYDVTDILMDGVDCTITGQGKNEDTGFYEVQATLSVPEKNGRYQTGYNVKAVYYRRSANASKSSIRYAYNGSENTNGERIVDAEFFYPLKNTQEWSEFFTASRSDWNFRIWGAEEWDFDKPYTVSGLLGSEKTKYPVSVKAFDYTGHLDGTLFADEDGDGYYEPVVRDGQVQTHVLKNLCDYSVNYNGLNSLSGYTVYGYVFQSVDGGITNLTVQDMTIGVERAVHAQEKQIESRWITGEKVNVDGTELRQTVTNNYSEKGLIRLLKDNSYVENVHLIGGTIVPGRNGAEYLGGLVANSKEYVSVKQCSATGLTIMTSKQAGDLRAGGLMGLISAYADIEDCYVTDLNMQAVLSKNSSFNAVGVGGLVGYAGSSSSINNCYSAGTLNSEVMNTGGLVGTVEGTSSITDCYSAMNISLGSSNGAGLLAKNTGTLTMSNCLYTGSLGVASKSDTVHLFLGYNASSASLERCYYYQPHLEENSSLIDAGASAKSYENLTGSNAYDAIFSKDHHYRYSWDLNGKTLGTTAGQGAYLPALEVDGSMMIGQLTDGVCHVPAIAEESLEIRDVWAFDSADRESISKVNGSLVSNDEKSRWYSEDLKLDYEPNDVEFTLVLGSKNGKNAPNYQVRSIEVEGLTAGTLGDNNNFRDNSGVNNVFSKDGAFTSELLKSRAVRLVIDPVSSETDADSFAYRIRLLGAEMSAYRDVYNVVVTLDNGVVLKKTFQFRNAKGVQEAKYLGIHNAYEWNLYLGESGNIVDAAQAAAEKPEDKRDATEKVLAEYAGWSYHGYNASSFNIEIAGKIDFSVLNDVNGKKENPVTNVLANNVRGKIGDAEASIGMITNLNLEATNAVYGLFRNIGGSVTDLNFENNAIRWKTSNRAADYSGLLGQVAGGMSDCTFTNTILTGGGNWFGIMATCDGTIKNVKAVNSFIESDGSYVGGLVGLLRGDLVKVTAQGDESIYDTAYTGEKGYQVTGVSYIGGIAGRTLSIDHETNGHKLIGGADRTGTLAAGASYTDLNPDGWYSDLISDAHDYRADHAGCTEDHYLYDSLSCNYALVQDVSLENINVTSNRIMAGGISSEVSYIKKAMGYGYALLDKVDAKNVQVQVLNRGADENAYTGGLYGYAPNIIAHEVALDSMQVDGSGRFTGGMIGYTNVRADYDYSAYGSGEDRVQYFLSVFDKITLTNSSVQGTVYAGGLVGYSPYWSLTHNIRLNNNVVLGQGNYVGGMAGAFSNSYTTDVVVENQQVYNSGESKYTGGIAGYYSGYGTRRTAGVGIQVLASGESSYVGGLYGYGPTTRDTEEHSNVAADIRVYGHDYVGGLYGNGSWLYYTDVNQKGTHQNAVTGSEIKLTGDETIQVTGTGDYVGGLLGTTGTEIKYDQVSNVTVIGSGIATGGVVGKRTSGSLQNCDFRNITVIGSGSGSSAGTAYRGNEEVSDFTNGSCVGGISGTERNTFTWYTRIQDVNVYGSGDYVGGLVGLKSSYYMQELDVERVTVQAEGSQYVGGMIGYNSSDSTSSRLITDAITVKAPKASCVGGFAGYAESTTNKSAGGVVESLIKVTIESADGTANVGGLIGYGKDVYSLIYNTVEATVKAPNAAYVAGVIGQLENTGGRFYIYKTMVSADVTGKDYVSGMIGYSGEYQPVGYNGSYYGIYCNLIAADLKVTTVRDTAVASYVYSNLVNGAVRKDVDPRSLNASSPYPYRQRLWDESSITYGYSEGTDEPHGTRVSVKEQKFEKSNGTSAELKYWIDPVEEKTPKESYVNGYALVSTNTLKNPRFYNGGNASLEFGKYADTIKEDGSVTFADTETLLASSTKVNMYGLYPSMTTKVSEDEEERYLYLPVYLNPLLLNEETARNVNNANRYVPYYIGTAEKTDNGATGIWKFTMKGGVNIPGTAGSILTGTNDNTAGTVANIDLKTAPRIYASNAYTLNVEFSTADTYAGAWIEVYDNTDGKAGVIGEAADTGDNAGSTGSGDNSGTGDETTEAEPLYRVKTEEETLTYSMLYNFTTPVTIKVTSAEPGTQGRYVAAQIDVDGKKLRKHAAMSNSFMYVIGSDGQLYFYQNGWSKTPELNSLQPRFGERAINIVAENDTFIVLTDKGYIMYLQGSSAYNNKYLQCIAGEVKLDNVGEVPKVATTQDESDVQETGSVQGTNTYAGADSLLHSAVQAVKAVAQKADGVQPVQVATQKDNGTQSTAAPRLRDCPYLIASTNGLPRGVKPAPASMQVASNRTGGVKAIASNTAQSDTEDKMEKKSNTENLSNTDAKTENTATDEKTSSGTTADGASASGTTTTGGGDSTATTGGASASDTTTTGDGASASDTTATGDGITADDSTAITDETGAEATLPADDVLDDESDVVFDESLLDAEPLYQFDYKDYHICTYLTYSLIFDGDQVTVRNMQLFVKNGQLFALNAPDEVVPGSVLIDTYQGHTYMTVVTQDGKMVDLMDEINYPEDFQNRDIRAISTNLFSDLTFVQVEYENGTIETFNYLTGAVVSVEEGGEEGTASDMDFFSYIMAFFRDKFDTAYAEVSNAYQNAVGMQDFLSTQPWRDWFAKDGKSEGDGEADTLVDATMASDSSENGTANGKGDATDEVIETDVTEAEAGTDGTEAVGDGSADAAGGVDVPETADGSNGTESGSNGNASGNTAGMDAQETIEGTTGGETGTGDMIGSNMPGVSENDNQQSTDGAHQANPSSDMPAGGAVGEEALTGETFDKNEAVDQNQADALTEQNDGMETEAQDGESEAEDSQVAVSVPADNDFDDELIIAYNADSKGYAVYSAEDLLTEDDEKLVSVDKKMDEYLQNGGELTGQAPQIKSLEVDRHQKNGILIMLIIGVAIAGMLTILAVQKYSRRRR